MRARRCFFTERFTGIAHFREMTSPSIEKAENGEVIRPIYSQTQGINSKLLETLAPGRMRCAARKLTDASPNHLEKSTDFCRIKSAIRNIHFPADSHHLEMARHRLIFEELLILAAWSVQAEGTKT